MVSWWHGPGMAAEPAASPETVTLVGDGVCLGRIVLDPDPERRQAVFEKRAVELLQHCVEKATGAALPKLRTTMLPRESALS